jgi:hypothetical protein
MVQLDAEDPYGWYMREIKKIFKELNIKQSALNLVHLSDNSFPPHNKSLLNFYLEWALVFRNYWWEEPIFRDLLKAHRLYWFPLGYSHHMKQDRIINNYTTALSMQNFLSSRSQQLFFLGNKRSGNVKREKNLAEIQRVMHIDGAVRRGGTFGAGSRDEYAYGLFNSKFCLQLPGRFPECYRFYDALETGCIPLFIDEFLNANYSELLSESMARYSDLRWINADGMSSSDLPFIRIRGNVVNMKDEVTKLLKDEQTLTKIAMNCQLWWNETKRYYRRLFETRICST